jgi:hypothetical protein
MYPNIFIPATVYHVTQHQTSWPHVLNAPCSPQPIGIWGRIPCFPSASYVRCTYVLYKVQIQSIIASQLSLSPPPVSQLPYSTSLGILTPVFQLLYPSSTIPNIFFIMYFGLQDTKPPPCPLHLTKQGGSIHCSRLYCHALYRLVSYILATISIYYIVA